MNKVDKFYREKEILGYLKKWTTPLSVNVNEDKEVVEINFHPEISREITKKEKVNLLCIIRNNMEQDLRNVVVSNGNPKVLLIKKLEDELKEMKKEIKKDLGIVKGGDYIEN